MKRLRLLFPLLLAVVVLAVPIIAYSGEHQDRSGNTFQLVEATIGDIQHAYHSHVLTPELLVNMYLARIAAYDGAGPHLNSYMHVNEHAVEVARALQDDHPGLSDEHGNPALPLFGIPVIVKDNINTADMPTTAGSVALGTSHPQHDAFIVEKLRNAGAIIMGKATLTEFANFLTNGMPSGFSSQLRAQQIALGGDIGTVGYGFNPYDPRPDPRTVPAGTNDGRPALSPGGSSSGPGIAVASNLATIGVGTETSGSILSPGFQNLLVGIKPTVGLVSRSGIVPITADQDTAGPLARTVTDAARLLGVLAGFDPQDPATAACLKPGNCLTDYTKFLDRHALRGARIAVPHYAYWTTTNPNDPNDPVNARVNLSPEQQQVMNDAIAVLRAEGATVVDPFEIPDQFDLVRFPGCGGLPIPPVCSTVLLFGFKRDLNAYLANLGPTAAVHTLADVIAFNNAHVSVALKYGQVLAVAADTLNPTPGGADFNRYQSDRAKDLDIAKVRGLDMVFKDFDAVLFPANRGANIAARAGYPSIVVPGGFFVNPPVPPPPLSPPTPFPPGFNAKPAPYGVTFTGPAFSEGRLIGFAYDFEQATHHRTPPDSTPPLPSDVVHRDEN
ncbi:MAG TPA: amidase family protein [Terriglobales bacterium]